MLKFSTFQHYNHLCIRILFNKLCHIYVFICIRPWDVEFL